MIHVFMDLSPKCNNENEIFKSVSMQSHSSMLLGRTVVNVVRTIKHTKDCLKNTIF